MSTDAQGLIVSEYWFSSQTCISLIVTLSMSYLHVFSCYMAPLFIIYLSKTHWVPDFHESVGNLDIEMVVLLSIRMITELDM